MKARIIKAEVCVICQSRIFISIAQIQLRYYSSFVQSTSKTNRFKFCVSQMHKNLVLTMIKYLRGIFCPCACVRFHLRIIVVLALMLALVSSSPCKRKA